MSVYIGLMLGDGSIVRTRKTVELKDGTKKIYDSYEFIFGQSERVHSFYFNHVVNIFINQISNCSVSPSPDSPFLYLTIRHSYMKEEFFKWYFRFGVPSINQRLESKKIVPNIEVIFNYTFY